MVFFVLGTLNIGLFLTSRFFISHFLLIVAICDLLILGILGYATYTHFKDRHVAP